MFLIVLDGAIAGAERTAEDARRTAELVEGVAMEYDHEKYMLVDFHGEMELVPRS